MLKTNVVTDRKVVTPKNKLNNTTPARFLSRKIFRQAIRYGLPCASDRMCFTVPITPVYFCASMGEILAAFLAGFDAANMAVSKGKNTAPA